MERFKNLNVKLNPAIKSDSDPRFIFTFHYFKCPNLLCLNKKPWYSGHKSAPEQGRKCKACQQIVWPFLECIGFTPRRDLCRLFGRFRCHKCSRSWVSSYSWKDCSQDCEVCKISVYPIGQHFLRKPATATATTVKTANGSGSAGTNTTVPKGHKTELCQKCKTFGDCRQIGKHR